LAELALSAYDVLKPMVLGSFLMQSKISPAVKAADHVIAPKFRPNQYLAGVVLSADWRGLASDALEAVVVGMLCRPHHDLSPG
jgi:hypothetical protein